MTDDVSVTQMLTEHIASLVSEAVELHRKKGWMKRRGRKTRPLARRGSIEAALIRFRGQLVRRHARGGFDGVPISTADLMEMHARQGGLCAYSHLPYKAGEIGNPLSVSVDRLNPSLGWTRDNVVLCCLFSSVARNGWPLELVVPLWRFLPRRPGTAIHYRPGKEPETFPL